MGVIYVIHPVFSKNQLQLSRALTDLPHSWLVLMVTSKGSFQAATVIPQELYRQDQVRFSLQSGP